MTTILAVIVVVVAVGILVMTALSIITDRASRADAWRQIALERRWNHEHHDSDRG